MKYGFNYYPAFRYYEEEQVGYIVFKNNNITNREGLVKFHKDHPVPIMRLVGSAEDIIGNNIIETAAQVGGIIVMTDESYNNEVNLVVSKCREDEVPFAFYNPLTKWDVVNFVLSLGVHDITVGEDIAFDIKKLSKVCKIFNTELFVYCNIAQNGSISGAITDFYVRPEDVKFYEDYVDCMFFHSNTKYTPINTLYEIYAHDETWPDYAAFVIEGLEENFDSRNVDTVSPYSFGKSRLDCGKSCIKGGGCRICYTIKSLCDMLHEKNLILEKVDEE